MQFPLPIQNLISHFRGLPGVGPKTAARFVFALINKNEEELQAFGRALIDFKKNIRTCNTCFNIALQNPCPICADQKRDHALLCIVARPQDVQVIEDTREYHGLFHVLGGNLNPIEGVTPDQLRIKELLHRLSRTNVGSELVSDLSSGGTQGPTLHKPGGSIQEIILALNPDLEGESTALYLSKLLKTRGVRVTRLARGLQQGADLEYADEVTLINAIKGRREV